MDQAPLMLMLHALGLDVYLPLVLSIIGLASAVAAILPQPQPGSSWVVMRKLLDLVAMNVGAARNIAPSASSPMPPSIPMAMACLLCIGLVLSACTSTPTVAQRIYAAEQAYTVAANAEITAATLLSADDRATMVHLDEQAYAELVKLRAPAATGSATATDAQAALDAVNALSALLAKAK